MVFHDSCNIVTLTYFVLVTLTRHGTLFMEREGFTDTELYLTVTPEIIGLPAGTSICPQEEAKHHLKMSKAFKTNHTAHIKKYIIR